MTMVNMTKCPRRTNHFNLGQKLWLQCMTGACAARVVGKFRGKGRYVEAWIKWDRKNDITPTWKTFEVAEDFAKKHDLYRWKYI